jgi:F420-0:gamma-glutamyl ligase-like protein
MIKLKNILLEKKALKSRNIKHVAKLTDSNNHTRARLFLSVMMDNGKLKKYYEAMNELRHVFGGYGPELSKLNQKMDKELYKELKRYFSNADEIISAL